MQKDKKIQIRISSELYDHIKQNYHNTSLFFRDAARQKIEADKSTAPSLPEIEIRIKTPFTYFAKLIRVIYGDSLLVNIDLGFFTTTQVKLRLADINTPPIDTEKGIQAKNFVEQQLTGANLIIETVKRGRYGRYIADVYYHKKYKKFTNIIRHGNFINHELVKQGLAEEY